MDSHKDILSQRNSMVEQVYGAASQENDRENQNKLDGTDDELIQDVLNEINQNTTEVHKMDDLVIQKAKKI